MACGILYLVLYRHFCWSAVIHWLLIGRGNSSSSHPCTRFCLPCVSCLGLACSNNLHLTYKKYNTHHFLSAPPEVRLSLGLTCSFPTPPLNPIPSPPLQRDHPSRPLLYSSLLFSSSSLSFLTAPFVCLAVCVILLSHHHCSALLCSAPSRPSLSSVFYLLSFVLQ